MAVFWFWFTFLFAGIRHLPHVLTVAPRDSYTQSWEDLSPFLESGCCYSGNFSWLKIVPIVIIIIMYIYRALINALSAHIIHINLNIIFCTHAEHRPIKNKLHKVVFCLFVYLRLECFSRRSVRLYLGEMYVSK